MWHIKNPSCVRPDLMNMNSPLGHMIKKPNNARRSGLNTMALLAE
jgi:hypothetical protein